MTIKINSIIPAFLHPAGRAAASPLPDADPEAAEGFAVIAATVLAVVVVGLIAVLMGMT